MSGIPDSGNVRALQAGIDPVSLLDKNAIRANTLSLVSDLVRGGSMAFMVKVVGAAIAFALNVGIARVTDPATYGIYVFTLGWVAFAGLGMRLGLDTLVVRLVANYRDSPASLHAVRRWAYKRLLIQTVITLILTTTALMMVQSLLSATQFVTFLIALPLLVCLSWNALAQSIVQGFGEPRALLPDQVIRPAGFIVILGAWVAFNQPSPTSTQLIIASALAALAAWSVSLRWAHKLTGPHVTHREDPEQDPRTWGRALPSLFFITGASVLLSQTDILLLGILAGDSEVGTYGAACRIVVLVTFALTAINTVLAPTISNLWAKRELEKLQSVVSVGVRISFSLSLGIALILWIGAEWVLSWFGAEFVVAAPALRILLVGQVVNAFVGSVGVIQMMTGHERAAALFMGLAVVVNVILNLILIPRYGILGAAAGTACATALWNLCGAVFVHSRLGIRSTAF